MLKRTSVLAATLMLAACGGDDVADDPAMDMNMDMAAGDSVMQPPQTPMRATAELRDANDQVVGTVSFEEIEAGVRVTLAGTGLPEGTHAFHIHETGECTPPDFTSAGGHFNPTNAQHGLDNPQGPHAGDMPNVDIGADGTVQFSVDNERITLSDGPNSILDADGSAVMIHASADDNVTDPSGDAGARIACGVVTAL